MDTIAAKDLKCCRDGCLKNRSMGAKGCSVHSPDNLCDILTCETSAENFALFCPIHEKLARKCHMTRGDTFSAFYYVTQKSISKYVITTTNK